jgi:CubicO group peptidase (beta-lactamase class C family)
MLDTAVGRGAVPGVALTVGIRGRELARVVCGFAELVPGTSRLLAPDTLFDLASLTKVMATAPAILALLDRGSLSLDDPLGRYVPGFRGEGRDDVRLRHLLTHTSGLPASRRFYLSCSDPAEMRYALLGEPLVTAPGSRVLYSDLGFLLLGDVVEAVTGLPLDRACVALLYEPLGMASTRFRPLEQPETSGAPVAMTTEPGGEAATGLPHDRNAQLAGGVAGHAGLFSTVHDVGRYAAWWSGREQGPVSVATRAAAMRCSTPGLQGRRGWGWVTRGDADDFLGEQWSSSAVTHTGFTGTSIAVDPARGWWVCLLTNAIHLGRNGPRVGALRSAIHRLAVPVLEGAGHRTP